MRQSRDGVVVCGVVPVQGRDGLSMDSSPWRPQLFLRFHGVLLRFPLTLEYQLRLLHRRGICIISSDDKVAVRSTVRTTKYPHIVPLQSRMGEVGITKELF